MGEPLRVNVIESAECGVRNAELTFICRSLRTPHSELRTLHELHQPLRRQRYRPWVRPRGARHRVQDRWRGSVDRQLAQALRATGAVRVRVLEECNANRWHV